MPQFYKNDRIGQYAVSFPIKDAAYAETYRVKDSCGKNYFLKLFNYAKLHRTQFSETGEVLELSISRLLNHTNLTKYRDCGELIVNGQKLAYIVYDFISGETVAQKCIREHGCRPGDAKVIIRGVLNGVKYLHSLGNPVIHNELTIQNIMLDMSGSAIHPKIIDFGYARFLNQDQRAFQKNGLNPFYMAPEAFNGVFSIQTDLYSVGVMLYHLLFGLPPYFIELGKYSDTRDVEDAILSERTRPLRVPDGINVDSQLINIIGKATASNIDDRFKSADEFLKAIAGEIVVEPIVQKKSTYNTDVKPASTSRNIKSGNGFSDVAGMEEFKGQLQSDVIDILNNPEQAKSLGISIPNGILFYGPPGCGKTYFAEKFAEELGCNYQYIKCSDIASPYIHGGQGKIAEIFNSARENSPTILFFDEIDAMIKDRSLQTNVSEAGEVNEFLAQLNNCGEDGVLVIGATNKPTEIDEAAIRAGRLELKYYIPNPDKESRKALFELNLRKRKKDFGLNYDALAEKTEGYVSADIKFIVDVAARLAFRRHSDAITMEMLEEAIFTTKPSLSAEAIRKHEEIRNAFEGDKKLETRKKIGF